MGFAWNPASQMVTRSLSNEAYEYPITNSVQSYAVNGRNQYTQVGGTSRTWDANGNLTSDGLTAFGYDTENRLVSASGAKTAALKYDPLGRLYEVSTPTPSAVTRFVYDGDRLIAEYSGSGTLLRRYVHGSGSMSRWSGTRARPSRHRTGAICMPTIRARSSPSQTPLEPFSMYTRTTLTASPMRATPRAFSTPARPPSPNLGCCTIRPASTTRTSAGSCRPIRSAMKIR
jgi:hypothetical protein